MLLLRKLGDKIIVSLSFVFCDLIYNRCLSIIFSFLSVEYKNSKLLPLYLKKYFYCLFDIVVDPYKITTDSDSIFRLKDDDTVEEYIQSTLLGAYRYYSLILRNKKLHKEDEMMCDFFVLVERSLDFKNILVSNMAFYCLTEMLKDFELFSQPDCAWFADKIFDLIVRNYKNEKTSNSIAEFIINSFASFGKYFSIQQLDKLLESLGENEEHVYVQYIISKRLCSVGGADTKHYQFLSRYDVWLAFKC